MLSGIASYFLNAPPTPTPEDDVNYRTMEAEDDWLLVDVTDGDSPQLEVPCERPCSLPTTLHVAVVDSSQEATPPSSPCPMDGSCTAVPASRALPGPRPAALAARAGWLEQLRPSQRSQVQREQRQLGRGQLERQNRTVQTGNRHPKRRDRTAARRSGANNNRKC
ncbi:uncharacterized protein LOC119465958 isoform X2 [Dermacentor silvarum]|uniref:uncharacterized protein LOC119465958 isoform X2 n=1 Tax=Dermacentor silvarum TaxID=543639 RepID=UPI0018982B93|nr:uncharacterized protein LOC119465958 isoform X2 [Dermacentor silvarum]